MVIIIILLIMPSAFFIDIIAHETYHAYKNKPYSESICFNLDKIKRAYTVVEYPNSTAKLDYLRNSEKIEELKANKFGRLISFLYILFIGLIISLFLMTLKKWRN